MTNITALPSVLNIPDKLRPMISEFNAYRFFLLEGGRGGAKTQSIARFIAYACEKRKLRVACGREHQNTIEESVYTVFCDVIRDHKLNFEVFRDRIVHRTTGSTIIFKGFREQGAINIKGLEGIDILWIDEAQAISKNTLDIINPTIRKEGSRVFFSMNRHLKNDPVYKEFHNDPKCLHIHINYTDNPFCSQVLLDLAEKCRVENPEDYKHIWLGEPLAQADNYLFNESALENAMGLSFPYDANMYHGLIIGGDVARFGDNYSCGFVLSQVGPDHWEEFELDRWKKYDTVYTAGKFSEMMTRFNPDHMIIDGDGIGGGVVDIMRGARRPIVEFRGGMVDGIDKSKYKNWRTYGYLTLETMINAGKLRLKSQFVIDQLREIKYRYDNSLRKYIIPKEQLIEAARKNGIKFESPDDADALMMAATKIEEVKKAQANQYTDRHSRNRSVSGRQSYAQEDSLL